MLCAWLFLGALLCNASSVTLALANLADLDMGEVSSKLMPLKDEVVMVLVREEEIGELLLSFLQGLGLGLSMTLLYEALKGT
jgi:uncharacterized membrane protein YczE